MNPQLKQLVLALALTALTTSLLGILVYFRKRESRLGKIFLVYSFSIAWWSFWEIWLTTASNRSVALIWARVMTLGSFIIPCFFLHFIILLLGLNKKRWILLIGYSLSLIFASLTATPFVVADVAPKFYANYLPVAGFVYPLGVIFFSSAVIYGHYELYKAYKSASGAKVNQMKYLFWSSIIGYVGGGANFLYVFNINIPFLNPYATYAVPLYIAVTTYAIVRYRLMDIQTVIHKTAMWVAMSSLVLLPIGGLFYLGYAWIDRLSPVQLSLLVGIVALLLIPYVRAIQPRIDHLFQRRKHDLQKILQDFIHEIVVLKGLNELVNKLQTTIASVLYPEQTSLILFDDESDTLKPFKLAGLPTGFSHERHVAFFKWLEQTNQIVEMEQIEVDPKYEAIREIAKKYFDEVQGKLAVPLIHEGKLIGVINLGQKKNLKPFTQLDLDFLANLKIEASIAFSNSLLLDDVKTMSEELRQWATELEHKVEERTKELAESKQEVENAYAKLKELDRIKSEFFANISHELRTPLTLIMAPLESIIKGELGRVPEAQQQHAEIMYQNSLRLLKLINNLLDLAKIDAGKMELYLSKVRLPDFIKGIVASVSPMAEKKQIRLSFTNGENLPKVACDKEKIEKALLNLIFNSLKFTEPGGSVTVSCGRDNGQVFVKVADTGIGIPKEHLGRIFKRFSQVDSSASRKHEGTGIGLALVKELVELHKGQVKAESEPGRGTVMTITLPMDLKVAEKEDTAALIERRAGSRRKAEGRREDDWTKMLHHAAEYSAMDLGLDSPQMSPPAAPAETKADAPRSTSSHRVLVVEDNADMLNFIAFQLKDDYVVLTARDGFEGVEAAKLTIPDLIISDVMMPGKDGYQLCQEVKADPKTKHIPVILLTAKAELSEKISGLEHGADDYLTKPFNAQELKAKIKSLINLRRLEREIQNRSEELERTLKELQETQAQLVHSEKMASVGYLVAGIAHEINNPISFAKGSLNNLKRCLEKTRGHLRDNEAVKDIEKAVSIIRAGLERTEQIVSDLKTFARKDETYFKPHNLYEGLDATLNLLTHSLGDRITVHKEYGEIGPVVVVAGQINQVFMNLLQNSIQAIPDRGDIWIRTERINSTSGDEVIISVKDNGVGIKAEHLGKIFDPFFTTKEVGKGMGLGLSISYKIIENHGGKIEAKSQEGRGTEMIIRLPVMQKRS